MDVPLFQQAVDAWLACQTSAGTRRVYSGSIYRFFDWAWVNGHDVLGLVGITRAVCTAYRDHLAQLHGEKRSNGQFIQTTTTARNELTAVRSFLTFCEHEDFIKKNSARGLSRMLQSAGTPRGAIPADRVHAILRAAAATNLEQGIASVHRSQAASARVLALSLLASTGMRVGELCSLKVRHYFRGELGKVTVLTKGNRVLNLCLHPDSCRLIEKHIRRFNLGPDDQLIGVRGQAQVEGYTVGRWLDRAATLAGVPRLTPHQLRSTLATEMHLAGVPIRDIQRQLGHASINMTAKYIHDAEDARMTPAALRVRMCPPELYSN